MSVTVKAVLVVGFPISRDAFYEETIHSVHAECKDLGTGAFCSSCGHPLGETRTGRTPHSGYNEEDDSFLGLQLVEVVCGGKETLLVGIHTVSVYGGYFIKHVRCALQSPDQLTVWKQKMKEILEPEGLWDEDNFGVWLGLYYS